MLDRRLFCRVVALMLLESILKTVIGKSRFKNMAVLNVKTFKKAKCWHISIFSKNKYLEIRNDLLHRCR